MTAPPSSELGRTTVATELVPGSVAAVDATARAFGTEARRITGLYDTFRAIRVEGWTGAAYVAFDGSFEDECATWAAYAKLLTTAERTLTTYSGALSSAQATAQTAIDTWAAGEAATRQAVTSYNQQVDAYNASVRSPGTATVCVARPGPFADPGQAGRDEAERLLAVARAQVDDAGHEALVALGMLEGAKTEGAVEGPGAEGSMSGPEFSWKGWEDTFGKDPAKGRDGRYDDDRDGGDFVLTLGNIEGAAWVLHGEGSVEDRVLGGHVTVNADGSFTVLGADGSAEATIDRKGLVIGADGALTLAAAEGRARAEWGELEVGGEAKASVEASAEGGLSATDKGLHAGGEVFAGARGSVEGTADVGGFGGSVGAEGWAGAGASADVDLGFDDGRLTVGGSGGLAWGVGGKVSAEIVLDFPEMLETGQELADGVRSWLD